MVHLSEVTLKGTIWKVSLCSMAVVRGQVALLRPFAKPLGSNVISIHKFQLLQEFVQDKLRYGGQAHDRRPNLFYVYNYFSFAEWLLVPLLNAYTSDY